MTYIIPPTDEQLLVECEVDTFSSSGPGGQNVNRRETAVRLRHIPSGLAVVCQQERSQLRNKQIALQILRKKLEKLNQRSKPRIPTKMPSQVKRKILEQKKMHSQKKMLRQKPRITEI